MTGSFRELYISLDALAILKELLGLLALYGLRWEFELKNYLSGIDKTNVIILLTVKLITDFLI